MGVRRLVALVTGLPPASALHRAVDPEGWEWTAEREIQAATFEALDLANAMYQAAHEKDGTGRLRKLLRLPRPRSIEEQQETDVVTDATEIDAFFSKSGATIKNSDPPGRVVTAEDIRKEIRERQAE